jgi:hypothetical protein
MSYVRFNVHFGLSHHGLPYSFTDAEVTVDSVKGVIIAMAKCLFIVHRSCIEKSI